MGKVKNIQKKHEMAQRSKQAIQLKLAGASYPEIAEALGVSLSTAHGDVQRALRDIPREEALLLRQVEAARLDRLGRELWKDAIDKDVNIIQRLPLIDRLLKLSDRRSKLLGIDAPQSVEISGVDLDLDAAVEQILNAAAARNSAPPEEDGFVDYEPEEIETPDDGD